MNAWAWALRAAASISAWRGVRLAVGDVVGHRVVEQQGFLRHQAEPRAQVAEPHVADVDAVDRDAAGQRVVEPRQQLQQRRLAAAVGADDGDRFAGADFQVDVAQHRLVRVVVEADAFEPHGALQRRQRHRVAADRRSSARGRAFVDAVGRGDGLLDVAELVRQPAGRVGHAGQHREEDAHHAVGERHVADLDAEDVRLLAEHQVAAHHRGQQHHPDAERFDRWG